MLTIAIDVPEGSSYHDAVTAARRTILVRALAENGGNKTRAARALGLQRTYLCRLVRDLRVVPDVCAVAES